jgi:hypothetical protein
MWRDNGNVSNSWAFGACKHVRDPNSHPLFQGGGCWSRVITHAATWVGFIRKTRCEKPRVY